MVNKCCVPAYKSNYKSVEKGVRTFDKSYSILLPSEWLRNIPQNITVKNTVVC